jgi:glyoxalase family protein
MSHQILGLHHITAIAGRARRNLAFYRDVLGLRFVKKTVNFDDPGTYHFYFGDEAGTPGTILTFFPWEHITPGRRGPSQATEIAYTVPAGSLDFWLQRFAQRGLTYNKPSEKFGEQYLTVLDPDGLKLELTVPHTPDVRAPWTTPETGPEVSVRGFHTVTLTLTDLRGTADLLIDVFGYRLVEQHVNRYRFKTDAVPSANFIDLVEAKGEARGEIARGSVHHVAFRVKDVEAQQAVRRQLLDRGLDVTPSIDRQYFHAAYFREPGGILFEIATDNPGFATDEPLAALGERLQLPPQYERRRAELEASLPNLDAEPSPAA